MVNCCTRNGRLSLTNWFRCFSRFIQQISGDKEQVRLHYVSHCQRGPLLDVIQRDRFKDRAVGHSLHGVHRDDLEFLLGDYPMKRGKSGAEQKLS